MREIRKIEIHAPNGQTFFVKGSSISYTENTGLITIRANGSLTAIVPKDHCLIIKKKQ